MNWINLVTYGRSFRYHSKESLSLPLALKDTPTRQAYRRVLRMMEDPDLLDGVGGGMAGLAGATAGAGNIFDDELDEDGNAIQKGDKIYLLFVWKSLQNISSTRLQHLVSVAIQIFSSRPYIPHTR